MQYFWLAGKHSLWRLYFSRRSKQYRWIDELCSFWSPSSKMHFECRRHGAQLCAACVYQARSSAYDVETVWTRWHCQRIYVCFTRMARDGMFHQSSAPLHEDAYAMAYASSLNFFHLVITYLCKWLQMDANGTFPFLSSNRFSLIPESVWA